MLIPSRAWGFIRSGLNGRFGVTVPNFGTGGPDGNPLDNDVDAGDEAAGVEFCPVFASQPSSGTLTVFTDGSTWLEGAADDTYVLPYDLYTFTPGDAASVDEGATTYTVTVGAVGATVSVPAGSLSLTGYAPTVQTPVTVSIPAGSLSLTGYAPTVSVTAGGVTVSVPAGSLSLTGYAPTVTVTTTIAIPAGELTLTGYAPFVYTTAGTTVDIPAGGLSLTGYAPTVYTAGSSTESLYYFPLREFAVSSSGSVDSTQDLENLRSLLPSQRQQVTNADGTMAAPWYRFFDFFVNVFAGGPSAPTMADVQAAIERALADLQAQQQTVALVAAQSQTNAEALAATVEVVQNNSLSGSSSIPAVSRTYLEP